MKITYWLQFTAVALVAVILFYGIYSGINNGRLDAKSEVILANTKAITEGLRYFFQDQNRYPSQEEFKDNNLMLAYITGYPPMNIAGGSCPEADANNSVGGFDYHSLDFKSYELNFCLPSGVNGFVSGINSIKQ